MRRHSRQRRGYVLLMTVSIIAIVGLLLIAIANHSLTNVTDAKRLRRDIQRKWALASCQRFSTDNVKQFLEQVDADGRPIQIPQVSFTVQLNDIAFDVLVSDESSKLDILSLIHI